MTDEPRDSKEAVAAQVVVGKYEKARTKRDTLDGAHFTMQAARYMRFLVGIAAILLPAGFAWLKFHDVDLTPIRNEVTATFLFRLALVLYYICWIAGIKSDIDDLEMVFVVPPKKKHLYGGGTSFAIAITAMFAILCYVDSIEKFAVYSAVFLIVDVCSWRYLIKVVLVAPARASKSFFLTENKLFDLARLELVYDEYKRANWQWARYGAGAIIILIVNIIAFSNSSSVVTEFLGDAKSLAISTAVLSYVMVMEIWIWLMR